MSIIDDGDAVCVGMYGIRIQLNAYIGVSVKLDNKTGIVIDSHGQSALVQFDLDWVGAIWLPMGVLIPAAVVPVATVVSDAMMATDKLVESCILDLLGTHVTMRDSALKQELDLGFRKYGFQWSDLQYLRCCGALVVADEIRCYEELNHVVWVKTDDNLRTTKITRVK